MEHIPLPEGVKTFIVVPYEAPRNNWYNGEGFLDYPQSHGWTEEQLRGGDDIAKRDLLDKNGFHTKGKPREVEQFFQTWLFFSLAIEFFKFGGVTVSTETFLVDGDPDGENYTMPKMVNTSKLPRLLVEWRDKVPKKDETWDKLNQMFERSKSILDRFCVFEEHGDRPLGQHKPRRWPVRDAIATTIIALTFSLRQATLEARDGYNNTNQRWIKGHSEVLRKHLERKWCIADVTTAFRELEIDGIYYLAASPGLPLKELDHHSTCVRQHCLYDYDSEMYVTRHTGAPWHKPGCKNTIQYGGQLGPERGQKDWVDAICKIINKDAIPIALWVKGLRTLWSVEYHLTGTRKPEYVAISHVWTDGKGNPRANSLPECQLDRITQYVENIHWDDRKPVPSNPNLSDGIGFWMDTLCVPVNVDDKILKRKAIASMRHVYSEAKACLVLDDWLLEISSESPILEIVARLYQSNWIKRLWTHQEGFLPKEIYIQFSDKSVNINSLNEKFETYEKQQISKGIYQQFPGAANMRLLLLYSFLKMLMKGVTDEKDKYMFYLPLASVMSERKTSKLADEIVCFATIIDMDVQYFLEDEDDPKNDEDAVKAQKRMARFLKKLKQFYMSVIFNNYDRLEEKGLKWAPKSLLNFRTPRLIIDDDERDTTIQEINGQQGLFVKYPGFILNFANGRPSFGSIERGCVIRCLGSAIQNAEGKWFIIELPSNNIEWTESASQKYAIILSKVPTKHGEPFPAIVGLTGTLLDRGIHSFEHCSIATARIEDAPPRWVDSVQASLLGSNTSWLVM